MKLKKKFGAFTLSLALLGGGLVGCGNSAPTPVTPVVIKHTVRKVAQHCTIGGISEEGYAEGTEVLFTVTPDSGYEVKTVTVEGTAVTPDNQGNYKFTMPDKNVTINAAADEIKVFELKFSPELKRTFASTASFTFGGVAWDKAWSIAEKVAQGGEAKTVVNEKTVTPSAIGAVTFTVTYNDGSTNQTKDFNFTIVDIEAGDTEDNPMTAKAAYDLCAALPAGGKSDRAYWVQGVVQEIITKDTNMEAAKPYATFMLEDDFEVYKTNFKEGAVGLVDNFDLGSKITVNVVLNHYKTDKKDIKETVSSGTLSKVENSTPFAVVAKNEAGAIKVGQTDAPQFRVAPKGSVQNPEFTVTVDDATIASYEAGTGLISAHKVGLAKFTVKYTGLGDLTYYVVGHEANHAGTVEDPMTTREIIDVTSSLPQDVAVGPFTYTGVVAKIEEEWSETYNNMTFNMVDGEDTFKCFHVTAADTEEDTMHARIVKGATVKVTSKVTNYKGNTPETDGTGAVIAADNTKIGLIELSEKLLKLSTADGAKAATLTANAFPSGISGVSVGWRIQEGQPTNVASVANGVVTPLAAGNTVVEAYVGDVVATCKVEVSDKSVADLWTAAEGVLPDGATLYNPGNAPYPTTEGQTAEGRYYVVGKVESIDQETYGNMHLVDKDNKNSTVLYSMYDKTGDVGYANLTVKPQVGDVIIVYAQLEFYKPKSGSAYNEIKNARLYQINGEAWENPKLTGLKLNLPDAELGVGDQATLVASPLPADAILDASKVTWASADTAKVSVTQDTTNKEKAVIKGLAITDKDKPVNVTASVEGAESGVCPVTVVAADDSKVTISNLGTYCSSVTAYSTTESEIDVNGTKFMFANIKVENGATNVLFQKGSVAPGYMYNKAAFEKTIKSVTIETPVGASKNAQYGVAFSKTAISGFTAASSYTKLPAESTQKFDCDVNDAVYFCLSVKNGDSNNGRILNIVIEFNK